VLWKLIASIVLLGLGTGAAMASSTSWSATLAKPARNNNVLIGLVIWQCDGMSCVNMTEVERSPEEVCRNVVKALGPVTSFASVYGKFDPAQLKSCDSVVKAN
jgi:hypothetical protein